MRICVFAMTLPVHATGGMEIHTLDLASGIAGAGHEVVIITSRHPRGISFERIGKVEVHYCGEKPTSRFPLGLKAMALLEELNAKKPFDVIHSQSGAASRYVIDGFKCRLGIPVVMTMHGTSRGEIESIANQGLRLMTLPRILFRHYIDLRFTRRFIGGCDAVIAISEELANEIPREFGIDPKKVKTIHNGIDTERFRPGKSARRTEGKKLILAVSVLQGQKGIQYLVGAMPEIQKRSPKAQLLVVGDGPYRTALEALAQRKGLKDSVVFAGRVRNEELRDYYNAADVFVIPTARVEGLPLVELESMSCGKPVVASRIGGIPTAIRDGKNGILVEPKDVKGLARAVAAVLEDEKLAIRLSKAARDTIVEGFSRERMVAETIKAYEFAAKTYY